MGMARFARPGAGRPAYRDRRHAGAALAEHLSRYSDRPDVLVLGLVRGGLPVAAEVAARLRVPLDALVVRKLGLPWAPEVAFGAIGPQAVVVYNPEVVDRLDPADMAAVVEREAAELTRRERRYRGGRPPLDLTGLVAIVIDDGLATGATARAAIAAARRLGADTVLVAVPVGAADSLRSLAAAADEVVCPLVPPAFGAVGRYNDFHQVSDDEVEALLSTG
jgi:putative phosphoribosyl transferase